MGGFHPAGEDAEVESLLNQLEEESLLELKVNSHSKSSATSTALGSGLDGDLLARYTNLKSRPVGAGKKSGGGEVHAKKHEGASRLKQEDEKGKGDDEISELEVRLNALSRAQGTSESKSSSSSSLSSSKLQSASSSPSPKPGSKSKSFSPMKLVKQMSMGKKKNKTALKGEVEDNISDVDKLLAATADELKLEKKNRAGKTELEDYSEEDEEDDDEEWKDLNVKKLKKELKVASFEEERLSREAQQVIQWAKDAARLESGASAGAEDSDVKELLRLEEESLNSKKKKGKKWSLF